MRIKYESAKCPDVTKMAHKDGSRPVLACLNLSISEDGAAALEATNSYGLVIHPVEIDRSDTAGLVPAEAVAEYVKAERKHREIGERPKLICGAKEIKLTTPDGSRSWPRTVEGTFPDLKRLVGEAEPSGLTFSFDAKLMLELAQALGANNNHVRVTVTKQSDRDEGEAGYHPNVLRPMHVRAASNSEAIGLLMPVRIS